MNSYNNGFRIQLFTARKKNAYGNKDFADYFPNEENERKIASGSKGEPYWRLSGP